MKSNRLLRYETYKKSGNVEGMKYMEEKWGDEFNVKEVVEAIEEVEEIKPKRKKK